MRSARASRLRLFEYVAATLMVVSSLACVASVVWSPDSPYRPILAVVTYATLLAGLVSLLANRPFPLAACFACSAVGAFVLRSAGGTLAGPPELLVVEVDAERFDPRYADALARSGADLVRVRGVRASLAAELGESFDYAHVFVPAGGSSIGLYSCHPLTEIDTAYTDGAAVLQVSVAHAGDRAMSLNVLSVAELPEPKLSIGRPVAVLEHAAQPTVMFAERPPSRSLLPAIGAASERGWGRSTAPESFSRATRGIFFAGELACTSSVVLRARGVYLGRGATFRSGPIATPLATL